MAQSKKNLLNKIVKKDYNNELEKILENKQFNENVKSTLLSILYKIEAAYKDLEIVKKVDFNTMRDFSYDFDGNDKIELIFENEAKQEYDNKILWKKQGNEKVVITLIYDEEV